MNLVPAGMARAAAETLLKTKQNSPHIFFGVGIVGIIGSTVLACRATLKLEETLDEIREEVDNVAMDRQITTPSGQQLEKSDADHAKDVGLVSIRGAVKLGRLYGPAIVVGGVGVACLTGSHIQLTRRNAALTAAFTAITKAYDEYRARVRAELGEERELDIYRGIETHEEKDASGKKVLVRTVDADGYSPYAKRFGPECPEWKPSAEFNKLFIDCQEKYANHRLQRDGFVLLNDVYEALGFPRTTAGAVVGWRLNSPNGDNYIDFGLFEARNRGENHMNDPSLYLDFNVDGVIYDQIGD